MGANNKNDRNALMDPSTIQVRDSRGFGGTQRHFPHCLGILHKIDGQVGLDNKDRRVTSYLQVLPRTMSMALQSYWKQVVQEYDEVNEDSITTLNKFNSVINNFFAGHSTEDNRHDLLESLCLAIKPETMKVQTFFYRIKELNDYVEWLPGHESCFLQWIAWVLAG
jgi:hypothetical protein